MGMRAKHTERAMLAEEAARDRMTVIHPADRNRFVREFRGPDADIGCSMVDETGRDISRCLMVVAYVDKSTNRAIDWPADTMELFYEKGTA